jgi:hypothetical protein
MPPLLQRSPISEPVDLFWPENRIFLEQLFVALRVLIIFGAFGTLSYRVDVNGVVAVLDCTM